jgi:FkbM family methyltransferase
MGGLRCVHPESGDAARWKQDGASVIIAVWNPYAPLDEVESELRAAGWPHIENFPRFYARHARELGERFWLSAPEFYASEEVRARIAEAAKLWADEKSRDLFNRWILARETGDVAPLNAAWREEKSQQYLPQDVEGWPQQIRSFIDGGAFDGDTLRILDARFLRDYYAFEPDAANFAKLGAAASTCSQTRAFLWPCGLWNETTTLSFHADGLGSSALADDGTVQVPVVALDDVLRGVRADVLKLDIEGAEPQALKGARQFIEAARPALAVCVYHHAEHLWTIPLLLDSWRLNYRFFLRAHACNGFEWVLYAVPI